MNDGKQEGTPISKLLAEDGHTTVGWVYLWNTGELAVLWVREELGARFFHPEISIEIIENAGGLTDADTLELLRGLRPV